VGKKTNTTARKARAFRGLTYSLAGFTCITIAFIAVGGLFMLRNERIEVEKRSLVSLSETLAAQTEGLFEEVHLLLSATNIWLASHPAEDPRYSAEFALYIDAIHSSWNNMIDLGVLTRKGELYAIPSRHEGFERIVLGRTYFSAQLDPKTRGFLIEQAVRDHSAELAIPVSYPLLADSPLAATVAFVRLPPLDALYARFRPASGGTISLFKNNGVILAHSPLDENLIGLRFGNSGDWERGWGAQKSEARAKSEVLSGLDGKTRIAAYRSVGKLNLVISVSSRLDEVLAWWRGIIPFVAIWAILVIGCTVFITQRLLQILDELGETRRGLEKSVRRLEESQAARDKLFSIISHDLRGPVGGIKGLLETLAAEHATMSEEDLEEGLKALMGAAGNTYALLEDLLAWSRSQSGTIRFAPRRILLSAVVDDATSVAMGQAAAKGLSIESAVALGSFVYADAEMLEAVLRNLLSNAIKYSHPGGTIWIRSEEAPGGCLVSVEDEGEGIEPQILENLFKIGAVQSRPGTAGERGTGLGLAVCKEFMEKHGGTITARSEPGKGARFELFFPGQANR
jgi:signal transduction histidine kinase